MMLKRILCIVLVLSLLPAAGMAELSEDEFDMLVLLEDEPLVDVSDQQNSQGAVWNFPVPLSALDPDYIRLANKHMYLPKDYAA